MKLLKPLLSFTWFKILPRSFRRGLAVCPVLLRHPAEIRYFLELVAVHIRYGRALNERLPWLPFRSIHWIDSFMTHERVMFEYGSGGSTVFFSRRQYKIISIEHNRSWHQRLSRVMRIQGIQNCELILAKPEPGIDTTQMDPSNPHHYVSTGVYGMTFKEYVSQIDRFPDNFIDLVIIDGRARPASLKHAIRKAKPNGAILLDDADRQDYRRAISMLQGWREIDLSGINYSGGYNSTKVWIKPANSRDIDVRD